MKRYDPNVSPYLLRPPMSYDQALRLWAEQDRARATGQGPADGDDSQAAVRRPARSRRSVKRAIDDA